MGSFFQGKFLPFLDWAALTCTLHSSPDGAARRRYSGPVEAGDAETGVSVMKMEAGLDTGPVLMTRRLPITPAHTAGSLQSALAELGAAALLETLEDVDRFLGSATSQDHTQASYANKIEKKEALIDWADSAQNIARRIRAFLPSAMLLHLPR